MINQNIKIELFQLQKYFLLILPISLVFSIFVADLILSSLFLIFVFSSIKNKNYQIYNNLYFKIFFIYWFYINILSLFSNDLYQSFKSSFFYIRFIFLPLIIIVFFNLDKQLKKKFFLILLSIILILFIDALIQFIYGKNLLGYGIKDGRISSFFGEEKVLGSFISKIFFIFSGFWFFYCGQNNFKNNLIYILIFIISFITILISGDRTPLFVFSICILLFIFSINISLKFKFISILILSALLVIPILLNQAIYDRLIKRTLLEFGSEIGLVEGARFYEIETEQGKKISFLTQQQNYFFTSVAMIKKKIFFGHSTRGYKINCKNFSLDKFSCASHPHNIYLQLFVENGIFGFVFLLSIFFYFTYVLIKNFINQFSNGKILNISEISFIISVYINLWPIAQTGNFYNNWTSILYYIPVAFVLQETNLFKKKIF